MHLFLLQQTTRLWRSAFAHRSVRTKDLRKPETPSPADRSSHKIRSPLVYTRESASFHPQSSYRTSSWLRQCCLRQQKGPSVPRGFWDREAPQIPGLLSESPKTPFQDLHWPSLSKPPPIEALR